MLTRKREERLASARFGNVLGSRGSLLDSLLFQLDRGLPVTITDPDITRYFMTAAEAASLVIETCVMADAGETYVLDMGEPVRILDLVGRLVHLLGIQDPHLEFTGLRPGEKLHEVLFDNADTCGPTHHRRIHIITARQLRAPTSSIESTGWSTRRATSTATASTGGSRGLLPTDAWVQDPLIVPV